MSSDGSVKDVEIEEVFKAVVASVSSEEPPPEEWSSLVSDILAGNEKIRLFQIGKYHPGSGEVCVKHIAPSDSAVLRHPLYWYPAVNDPGIKKALLYPIHKIEYPEDGQELYLDTCKEMNMCPVKLFHKGLVEKVIDLSYYGVKPSGLRAMGMALRFNRYVLTLNLTDNFLTNDSCFHLSSMLLTNVSLVELNLSGCRIGSDGLNNLIPGLKLNRGLKILNLDRNQLGDDGGEALGRAMCEGVDLEVIGLSSNNLEEKTLAAFVDAFSYNIGLKSLDVSWNNFCKCQSFVQQFLEALSGAQKFEEINLSWNGLRGDIVCTGIAKLLTLRSLKSLDLSHNMLSSEISLFLPNLIYPKNFKTLNLSFNPLTPMDADLLINKMNLNEVKLKQLIMDNVDIKSATVEEYKKLLKRKPNIVISYGDVKKRFVSSGPDLKEVVINRIEEILKKPKKRKVDIALVVLSIVKNDVNTISTKELSDLLAEMGGHLDNDLMAGLMQLFPSSKVTKNEKLIDLLQLAEYLKRKWPDRVLPPSPPSAPPPPTPPKN